MKLGYINYLNCYPYYYHMFEKQPVNGINIVPGLPGRLNRKMSAGELDMSPVSSASCADMAPDVYVLPDFCLSSVGYVGSVMLFSKEPIEALDKKKIGLSSASHTTVTLLKIILKKYYNVDPVYLAAGPKPDLNGVDACLVIGNHAMVKMDEPAPYTYDLGDLWLRKTGFPVVFAVFTVQKRVADKYSKEIEDIRRSFRLSLESMKSEREKVISCAGEKYPDIIYDLDKYFSRLHYSFSDDLKKALSFYHEMGNELGFLKKISKLDFYKV
ncbi:MAG: menaquinone biosynthesis protein [Desulfobacterales bacterium]|nr:menaquinone biosynthesis protein [Desulfobacterales bacterium]